MEIEREESESPSKKREMNKVDDWNTRVERWIWTLTE